MTQRDPPPPDPSELADGIRAGDRSAFDAFLKLHWASLVRYTATLLGSVDEAKDVVQEAFARLWESRGRLRSSGSARAYLYQIARNRSINERRRRELHGRLGVQEADRLGPRSKTPAQELDASELSAVVRAAVEALPERRREAFVLAHLEDLPHKEIAQIMGISPHTVANQISSALADLRRTLAPYLSEPNGDDLRNVG